jgi:hypothetical protein
MMLEKEKRRSYANHKRRKQRLARPPLEKPKLKKLQP